MKKEVTKAPKVALCRVCHGTGRTLKALKPLINRNLAAPQQNRASSNCVRFAQVLDPTKEQNCEPCVCPQCEGSGRVTVSAKMEYDIRPYKPKAL